MKIRLLFLILLNVSILFAKSSLKPKDSLANPTKYNKPTLKVEKTNKFADLDAKIALNEAFAKNNEVVSLSPLLYDVNKYQTSNAFNHLISDTYDSEEKFIDKLKKIFNAKNLKYVQSLTKNELIRLKTRINF